MKLSFLAAAAALAALAPVVATAQDRVVTEHSVTRTHTGPAFERHHSRSVCNTRMRHRHRVRVCRTVRY